MAGAGSPHQVRNPTGRGALPAGNISGRFEEAGNISVLSGQISTFYNGRFAARRQHMKLRQPPALTNVQQLEARTADTPPRCPLKLDSSLVRMTKPKQRSEGHQ